MGISVQSVCQFQNLNMTNNSRVFVGLNSLDRIDEMTDSYLIAFELDTPEEPM